MADNLDTRLYNNFGFVFPDTKRYRVQVQFDVHAESDKEAAELIGDSINNIKDFHNSNVIYFAEAQFANMNHRKINYDSLDLQIMDEKNDKQINDPLPF